MCCPENCEIFRAVKLKINSDVAKRLKKKLLEPFLHYPNITIRNPEDYQSIAV
jgi:hypothetical protein